MATQLAALLRTSSMGLPDLANVLQSKGRHGDTILAHINPKEARLLKAMGGAGTTNPHTGLPEFYDPEDIYIPPQEEQAPLSDLPQAAPLDLSREELKMEPVAPGIELPGGTSGQGPQPTVADFKAADVNVLPEAMDFSPASYAAPSQQAAAPAPAAAPSPSLSFASPYTGTQIEAMPSAVTPPPAPVTQEQPGALAGLGSKADALAKALGTDRMGLIRMGLGSVSALQGAGASRQAQAQANQTRAQIEAMAAPYKERGQQLVAMGQAGQLTPAQQQSLAVLRAQQAQQLSRMGASSGTAQMQSEAQIQQMAQQFAQQNIDQGMKLIGLGDQYVMDAIKQGYAQSKDAMAMSGDFYKTLLSSVPQATQQTTQQPQGQGAKQ